MSVSIILTTYNGSRRITKALDAVLAQQHQERECIIINDASTDTTQSIIDDYCRRDHRFRTITNPHNKERCRSRNLGILHARYDYIAFLDDDDIRHDTTKIAKQISFLEKNPDYSLVGTQALRVDEYGRPHRQPFDFVQTDHQIKSGLLKSNQFILSTVMARRTHLIEAGGFNPAFRLAEDYDLRLRCAIVGRCHILPQQCVTYLDRSSNTTNSQRNRFWIRYYSFMFARQYRKFFSPHSIWWRCRQSLTIILPPRVYRIKKQITKYFST